MAWSPFQRANAGIIWVEQPGDYANPIPTTAATGPSCRFRGLPLLAALFHQQITLSARVVAAVPSKIAPASTD